MKQVIEIKPIAGDFNTESSLMGQLSLLKTKKLATKWYKEYLEYHNGVDQGINYMIGYFADEKHRNNLYKWIK